MLIDTKKLSNYFWYAVIGLSVLYLLNLTFGVIEFLPDNLPLFGNIDEGVAGALIYLGLQKIGVL